MNRVEKLVSGSLKQQPVGPHPGADTLAAFAENALGRPERQRTIAHLAECTDCREILYLAQPDPAAAQETALYRPKRITHFALRWGAVAASLVIVAGGLFITRHEFWTSQRAVSEQKPAPPAYYDKLAEKKASPEVDSLRNSEPPAQKQLSAAVTKTRPPEKHMTAKPQANMSFDDSGQVRVLNRQESPTVPSVLDAADAIAHTGKAGKQRDDSVSANAPSSATAAYGVRSNLAENKIDSKDMPRATNETVEVSAAAPAIQTQTAVATGSAKLEDSRQKQSETRAFKQNGALLKTLAMPIAQWELSSNGTVQRSLDAGRTWRSVPVGAKGDTFGAIFSSGTQVWVGGSAGALYHSLDSGLTWTQMVPATAGQKLKADISHIEFSSPQDGSVSATTGETWLTSDGGQTWRKK
jgi:hypothetical protein